MGGVEAIVRPGRLSLMAWLGERLYSTPRFDPDRYSPPFPTSYHDAPQRGISGMGHAGPLARCYHPSHRHYSHHALAIRFQVSRAQ